MSVPENPSQGPASPGHHNRGLVQRTAINKQVADVIRDQILNGRLQAGDRIVQGDWAESLEVSRMPVRDAINQLVAEGLLEQSPNGAAVVAELDWEDVRDGYELMALIASFAARRAAEAATDREVDALVEVHREMATAVEQGRREVASRLDRKFHRLLNRAAHSSRVLALLRLLEPSTHYAFEVTESWPSDALKHHEGILDALTTRDSERVAELTYLHVAEGSQHMLEVLRRMRSTQDGQEPPG